MGNKIETLFLAYLEGRISSEDEQFLLEWLKNNPESIKDFKEFRRIWNLSEMAGTLNKKGVEKEWGRLLRRIDISRDRTTGTGGILYWLPRIAAVFLLGAVVSFAIAYQVFNPRNAGVAYHEINTPAGAKSQVTLPDGSTIWLNAGSNLKYSDRFGKKDRQVYLTGEAYFDVKKDRSKIFVVNTSELKIKAYGTTFNVKSYPEEGTIEATLIEGSIGVTRTAFKNKKTDEVMLEPNQRVVYYRKTNRATETEVEPEAEIPASEPTRAKEQKLTYLISKGIEPKEFTSWKDGILFITSETLGELAVKLERKYDVKIHFKNQELKQLKFTGSLENETVEQVMEAIGIAANIGFEIEDRDIWLMEK